MASNIKILESYVWQPSCDHTPFDFIPPLYTQRQEWKDQGRGAEKVLKLGLNSLYGKCAQHVGGKEGQAPPWHQLEWAGYTTSATRAALYLAAMQSPEDVLFIATDGIYSKKPLSLPVGRGLGEWDFQTHTGITAVQSGVYWVDDGDRTRAYHRGFDPGSLDRNEIIKAWAYGKDSYEATSTRFIGMGQALAGGDQWPLWRQWVTKPRKLELTSLGTKRSEITPFTYFDPSQGMIPTKPYDPSIEGLTGMSTPAALPWQHLDETAGDDTEEAIL